jgi:hypothetical protein
MPQNIGRAGVLRTTAKPDSGGRTSTAALARPTVTWPRNARVSRSPTPALPATVSTSAAACCRPPVGSSIPAQMTFACRGEGKAPIPRTAMSKGRSVASATCRSAPKAASVAGSTSPRNLTVTWRFSTLRDQRTPGSEGASSAATPNTACCTAAGSGTATKLRIAFSPRASLSQDPWEGSLDLPRRLRWAKPSSVNAIIVCACRNSVAPGPARSRPRPSGRVPGYPRTAWSTCGSFPGRRSRSRRCRPACRAPRPPAQPRP